MPCLLLPLQPHVLRPAMQDSDSQGANAKRLEGETKSAKQSIESSINSKKQEVSWRLHAIGTLALTLWRN